MNIESFINQKEFENLDKRLQSIKDKIQFNSFNLFTISTFNPRLEHFHSDIITMLLDPEERHKQKNYYLNNFLDFLIELGGEINKNDYLHCEISREKGDIDICIKDNASKRSIIIENKINNAEDQEDQIKNYYNYQLNSGYEVDAIVYLTLNGNKNAPLTDLPLLNQKIINIPAFTNNNHDLCNGWLKKCYSKLKDENNRSFVFQFIKLIKHLSQVGMYKEIKDEFYAVINKEDGFKKIKAIGELITGLEEYRADLFIMRINNEYLPFRKIYQYKPYHWFFDRFDDNGIVYKFDVHFSSNGSARIDFWNPGQSEETQRVNTSKKLESIGLIDEFEYGGFGGGMFKVFNLGNFISIEDVDNELYNFVSHLFEKLR